MQICKMRGRQINQALELIRKVFDECDKEDYDSLVHMKSLNWSA